MLSEEIYAEIARLTYQALAELSGRSTVECVTVIRGYVQLLAIDPRRKEYEDRLAASLRNLADIANAQNKTALADGIHALIAMIHPKT